MRITFFTLIFLFAYTSYSQKITISGYVKDSKNGETLIGANVFTQGGSIGTVTNIYGFYSLQLDKGKYEISCSYIGYSKKVVTMELQQSQTLNFNLDATVVEAKEVVITGEKEDKNITSNEMSKVELSAEKVKSLPALFGEVDILKTITLLPGIKSGGEGSTGFYVRGGGPDQNLILLDDAVIYNPSHLLGFFSVFNADAIKNIEIIKGGMPAQYGGRLSSILNITMKEGDNQKFGAEGGIGLISSRLMLQGPIVKNKSSFIATARRTYIDVLVQPFLKDNLKGNRYYFYDFNFKANYVLSQKDRIYLSGYWGDDVFTFKSPDASAIKFGITWGNRFIAARWNHVYSNRLFNNTSLVYNAYQLSTKASFFNTNFRLSSGLKDANLKTDFTFYANNRHKVYFGGIYTYHTFTPGIANIQNDADTLNVTQELNPLFAHEGALYVGDEWDVSDRLNITSGLRYTFFNQIGPYKQEIYNELGQATGKFETFKRGQSIKFYDAFEPRLNARFTIDKVSSIKGSVTRTNQYIHLATTSGATLPSDLWIPSSRMVLPQISWQYAAGYFRNFKDNLFETSVEAYYKPMQNQIEFRPGANLFFNQNLEREVIRGNGLSYGVEFFVKKNKGKLTGWLGYTLSRTTRTFNFGLGNITYPYRYDRTHDFSMVLSYKFSEKWDANFVWVYGTGNALTLPYGGLGYLFGVNNQTLNPVFNVIENYEKINDYRMPAYHRADVSVNYRTKKTKWIESFWNFALYNMYNRANPYFIYANIDQANSRVKYRMVYLFPVLPSVTWNFKF